MTRRRLVMDVDTGTDDAVALMLAAMHPGLELLGVSTVAGNVPVAEATDNTLRVLGHLGREDVPVREGLAGPGGRADFPLPREQWGWKASGTLDLPPARSRKRDGGAAEWLAELCRTATGPITLVATGPLGNIAAAVALDPGFARSVPELVLMGGADGPGNMTPWAEFNVWADPEAAAAVFAAGFPRLVCVPLDATRKATVSREMCHRLARAGTPAAAAAARLVEAAVPAGADEVAVHDALCVAFLLDPAVLRAEPVRVAVERDGSAAGRTVVDRAGAPNCRWASGADTELFRAVLLRTLAGA